MTISPRRRWFQFSLKTMLLLTTVACAGIGWWVQSSRAWIRQRHEALNSGTMVVAHYYTGQKVKVPLALWMLGEKGVESIMCGQDNEDQARRLFPEAQIFIEIATSDGAQPTE